MIQYSIVHYIVVQYECFFSSTIQETRTQRSEKRKPLGTMRFTHVVHFLS